MKHTLYILFIIIILAFSGCKKDDVQVQEFKITSESVFKNTSTIVVTVTYTYTSVLQSVEGYISESSDLANAMHVNGVINKNTFVLTFNDLHANTTYYYYYAYSNGIDHLTESEIKVATTNDYGLPTVITNDVTDITATSAICGGEITDDGEGKITARGVCYSLNENPTIDGNHTIDSIGIGSFSSVLVDLSTNTTYYVRAYATNQKGTSYGEQKSFITTDGLPTVTTSDVTDIAAVSATCGGNVTDDGGFVITSCGICWSTSQNPTISDNHTTDSTEIGIFTNSITGLNPYTTYYVRAYATNSKGTSYGNQKTFKTLIVEGGLNGLFSISGTQQICFSKGNLQYIGNVSTPYWKFAEYQWDCLGTTTGQNSDDQNVDRDLFGWGTSGYNHGAVCYQPWSTDYTYYKYYAYGNSIYNLNDQTGQADWGYNPISNGGNQPNLWRTLTQNEWEYVFNTRNTASGIRYAKAQVNGVNGVILLPDDWSSSCYSLSSTNANNASYSSNIITAPQWANLELHGAVFLPAAGYRHGTEVNNPNSYYGNYWSATYSSSDYAYHVGFYDSNFDSASNYYRSVGMSVRLVCDIE